MSIVTTNAHCERADGGAGVTFLVVAEQEPGERYGTFGVVRERQWPTGQLTTESVLMFLS
jgi:hypothetical protein